MSEPYQQRVIAELEELSAKLFKLTEFLTSPEGLKVPQPERVRLERQQFIMTLYQEVLTERIEAFDS